MTSWSPLTINVGTTPVRLFQVDPNRLSQTIRNLGSTNPDDLGGFTEPIYLGPTDAVAVDGENVVVVYPGQAAVMNGITSEVWVVSRSGEQRVEYTGVTQG